MPKTSTKAAVKPKEKKDTKIKEFAHIFAPTSANYLDFLNTILKKHNEEKYAVLSEKKRFCIKVQCPPAKYVFSFELLYM